MEKKSCDECHLENLTSKNILEIETKQFCSIYCLSSYSDEHYDNCFYCKLFVPSSSKIKFCLRFGTKVEQFCSSSCMTKFKEENSFCKLCHEPIHSFMLISDEEKFCSPFCVSRYNGRGINQLNFENDNPCQVCNASGVHHLEMLKDVQSIFFCSKSCVTKYNQIYGTIKYQCSLCGCLIESCEVSFYINDKFRAFCSFQCSSIFLTSESEILFCSVCKVKKFSYDLIKKQRNSKYYCSLICLNKEAQDLSEDTEDQNSTLSSRRSSIRTSNDSCIDVDTDNEKEESKNKEKIVKNILNKCYMRDHLAKVMKSRFGETQDKECQTFPPKSTSKVKGTQLRYMGKPLNKGLQTDKTINFIAVPFPIYIPQPIPQLQYQTTPLVIPVPVPVPVVIPLLKKANIDATSKEHKLTFNDVANQFILKKLSKETECENSSGGGIASTFREKDDSVQSCSDFTAVKKKAKISLLKAEPKNQEVAVMEEIDCESPSSSFSIVSKLTSSSSEEAKTQSCDIIPGSSSLVSKPLNNDSSEAAKTKSGETLFSSTSVRNKLLNSESTETANSKNSEKVPNTSSGLTQLLNNSDTLNKKSEYGNMTSGIPVATTSKEQEVVNLSSDSEDMAEFDIDLSGKWSSDSDILEIDLPSEQNKKKEQDKIVGEQTDSQFLASLIKECDITATTLYLRETLGIKVWSEFTSRKEQNIDFMKKISTCDTKSDKYANLEKSLFLEAFVKNFTQDSNFEINVLIYILLCFQKNFSLEIVDSLFTNVHYQKFGKIFFVILQDFMDKYHNRFAFYKACKLKNVVRIREDMLWKADQLGSLSPNVLLFTVFYINTKHFNFHTVDEHESATPKGFTRHSCVKTLNDGTPVKRKYISYNYPKADPRGRVLKQVHENSINVNRCPVKISDFYASKCPPIAGLTSNFYLTPALGCSTETKYWYTPRRLPVEDIKNMLNLTLMVEDVRNVLENDPA